MKYFAVVFALIFPILASAQNLYQPAPPMPAPEGALGFASNPRVDWGFLPFRRDSALINAYGEQKVNAVRTMSLAMFETSRCENADALSYIPVNSLLYTELGLSLVQSDLGTANEVTLQKLLNKGGNIALALSKPLYYAANSPELANTNSILLSGRNSFFYLIPRLSGFFDVPFLDHVFSGKGGARLDLAADYHVVDFLPITRSTCLFSFGIRGNLILNQFINAPNVPALLQRTAFVIGEVYGGIAFFQFTVDYNEDLTHANIFKGREWLYKVSIVPLKINW